MEGLISWQEIDDNHRVIMAGGDCRWCTRDGGDHDGDCEYAKYLETSDSHRSVEIWDEEQVLWVEEHEKWKKKYGVK